MLTLPLHNLSILLEKVNNSLSNFIGFVDDFSLLYLPEILFLFKVCISKDISEEDGYFIYLIDFIGLRVVGQKVHVYMEYQYRYEEEPLLMSFKHTPNLHYMKSGKYICGNYGGNLILRRTQETPTTLDYSSCSNKKYYNQIPQVTRILFLSSFLIPYINNKKSNTCTPYENWILHYIGMFELLCKLNSSYNIYSSLVASSNLDIYISQLRNTQAQLIESINTLFNNYYS